jgi:signal transduction histidine kinase
MEELRKADQKGLEYRMDSKLDDDFIVMSSPRNLRRILQRVLDNAVKFTDHGSIVMSCEKIGHQLVVSISDTGIGIAPQDRDRVFEKFVQLDDYTDGVGLGLPLSRRLARNLGGDLQLDNTYKGGSRFLFTLPV